MTGREFVQLHAIMLEAYEAHEKDRAWYEGRLEELAPDANTDEAKRYRRQVREADEKAKVCAGVLNSLEMMTLDVKL